MSSIRDRAAPLVIVALVAIALTQLATSAPVPTTDPQVASHEVTEARWFLIDVQVLRSNHDGRAAFEQAYLTLIEAAAAYGYNGVIIRGAEVNALGDHDRGRDDEWLAAVQAIAASASLRDMDVVVSLGSIGRCNSLLASNSAHDLATAYPVTMRMEPVAGAEGALAPTSAFHVESSPAGKVISGNGSLKATVRGLERGGHYRVRVAFESSDIDTGSIAVQAADATTQQSLNRLLWAKPSPTPATTDIAMSFNSFASSEVVVFITTQNRSDLTLEIDEFSVEAVPTLNGLSRDGTLGSEIALALDIVNDGKVDQTLTLGHGLALDQTGQGRDPHLGEWDTTVNTWSARHAPPTLHLTAPLAAHDELRLRAWHALPFKNGVSCSWNDPAVSELIGRVASYAVEEIGATRIILPFDEVNSGGAEPADGFGTNTSLALANSIDNQVAAVRNAVGPDVPVHMYGDMLDRNANARPCYSHVVGSLASPLPVPDGVSVLAWDMAGDGSNHFLRFDDSCAPERARADGSFDLAAHRARSLTNLAALTDEIVIAGYYDAEDPDDDFRAWQQALAQSPTATGNGAIYTTWVSPTLCRAAIASAVDVAQDVRCTPPGGANPCSANLQLPGCAFEHLEQFADLWWRSPPEAVATTAAPAERLLERQSEPPPASLAVTVDGTGVTVRWSLPTDELVNGTWLQVDGAGTWTTASVLSATFDNLAPGEHSAVAWATRRQGGEPIEIGTATFTIAEVRRGSARRAPG